MARWAKRVNNEDRMVSPYDEQARSSRKRELVWLGYKVHLTETCDQEGHVPHLIVQVHTVPATVPDSKAVEPILQDLRERKIATRDHVGRSRLHERYFPCRASKARNTDDRPSSRINELAGASWGGVWTVRL